MAPLEKSVADNPYHRVVAYRQIKSEKQGEDGARSPVILEAQRYHRAIAHPAKEDKAVVERRAAIERTRGIFAHVAPGESLVGELIADRRAEVRAEELQETERRRHRGAS